MGKDREREEMLREYLRQLGRKGGLTRAKKHTKKQLSEWAKLGGRPRKSKQQKES